MNIMVMAGGCKAGGGIQVADSICRNLNRYPNHRFIVVLSNKLEYLDEVLAEYKNIKIVHYTTYNSVYTLLTGRDKFLDNIVLKHNIDIVNFVFGPSLWIPKVLTVAGFAMAHLLLQESPYWATLSKREFVSIKFKNYLQKKNFDKLSACYYTENPYITDRLKKMFKDKRVDTITNCCHQVFDNPNLWDRSITLPKFEGHTLLTICAPYPHKNLGTIPQIIDILTSDYPNFKVRFVVTCEFEDIPNLGQRHRGQIVCLGKVNINQCPWLYIQSDAMFLPTMLECFSANYVEAMKMHKPILTSDLGFATGLCGAAAEYFNPIDVNDIARTIYKVLSNKIYVKRLVENGKKQLELFDSSQGRTDKLINLLEVYYKQHSIN